MSLCVDSLPVMNMLKPQDSNKRLGRPCSASVGYVAHINRHEPRLAVQSNDAEVDVVEIEAEVLEGELSHPGKEALIA